MTTRFRRPMLVLGTIILVMQAVFLPGGMVYAELTIDTEEQELVELPPMKNFLEEQENSPRFFFSQSSMYGTVDEPLQVTFFSDQEVSEVRIFLPEEATFLKHRLPTGIAVEEGVQSREWIVQSERVQKTFVLPLVFKKMGEYALSVEETTMHIEISEHEEPVDVEVIAEELLLNESDIEENKGSEQLVDNLYDSKVEILEDINVEEINDSYLSVTDSVEFISAINNSEVSTINILNDITVSSSSTLTRGLRILGNGHTLNFGSNSITLGNLSSVSELELNDLTVIKGGSSALFTSSYSNSINWVLNIDSIKSGLGNVSGLIDAPLSQVVFSGGESFYEVTGTNTLIMAQKLIIENGSNFTSNIRGTIFANAADNSEFIVKDGSTVNWTSNALALDLDGNNPIVNITDPGTSVNISSTTNSDGGVFIGGSGSSNRGATIHVKDYAEFNVHGTRSTALLMRSHDGVFIVENNASLRVVSDTSSGNNAALRFRNVGNYTFQIRNNSSVKVEKYGGTAPGIRMYGDNNSIEVSGGSKFYVYNAGNGSASNSNNSGIQYRNGNDQLFSLSDEDSSVNIKSDFGPAVVIDDGRGSILAENGTVFIAEGRTSSSSSGIFSTGRTIIELNQPKYFDFRNNRPGGGNVYNVSSSSTFTAMQTVFSAWFNGSDFNNDPDRSWNILDFSMSGSNFSNITSTSVPDEFNASSSSLGSNGFTSYSRLSANNASAVVDELRVPTTADKKIFGHVSIPEGNGYRSAWTDEVMVGIEVLRLDGTVETHYAKTVGSDINGEGISIYGEPARSGIFQINLDRFLEVGEIVTVKSVIRGDEGRGIVGTDKDIIVGSVEVFPIIPPTPAKLSSTIITQYTTTIRGVTDNQEAEVTATHNDDPLNTENVKIDKNGNFTLDLRDVSLEIDDEIQVFLRDSEGSAEEAGVINPPETNNTRGNINPATELVYHDATFEPATIIIVSDTEAVTPVDPLDPEVEVDPENKPELPEDQGLLSIDFVSKFDFGSQVISAQDQIYYAKPQRLLTEDQSVSEDEERPNYIQVSDRRSENERNGWQLAVTQKEQFQIENTHELSGAQLQLMNQQLVTAHGGKEPSLHATNPLKLVPGNKRTLLRAEGNEGTGTWIYRFGDADTAGESVALHVPKGTTPEANHYATTLMWELIAVPGN